MSGLETLLGFVPASWAELDAPIGFGPAIYLLDFEQMRTDLAIPGVTGSDSRQDKLPLIVGLNTQALDYVPDEVVPTSGSAYQEWGWDIADVRQAMYLPDHRTGILLGRFDRSGIARRLTEKGYSAKGLGDAAWFTTDPSSLSIVVGDGYLMVGKPQEVDAAEILVTYRASELPTLASHPYVRDILDQLDHPWGALLAPSPDWVAFVATVDVEGWRFLHPEVVQVMARMVDDRRTGEPLGWDFMAVAFSGIGEETDLTFLYRYPNAAEAVADLDLVRMTLSQTPLVSPQPSLVTWGTLMTLESVVVRANLVVARAHTPNKSLLGRALEMRDYWGLVPSR